MLIKVQYKGKTVTRETSREDVTHVMVCTVLSTPPHFKIMGLHKSESKARADVRKCEKNCPALTDFEVHPVNK